MFNGIKAGTPSLAKVAPQFKSADLALANLEVPLTSSTQVTQRKTRQELATRQQFILKGSPAHLAEVQRSGIRLVSLANNHAADYGPRGIAEMQASLTRSGIAYAGAGQNSNQATRLAVATTKSGLRVGLLSSLAFISPSALKKCTPATAKSAGISVLSFNGAVNAAAQAKLNRWIGSAKKHCDFLVVGFHWGIERQPFPTGYQRALARGAINAGADVVWGHHPHVLQGSETYRGKLILYSMGNLVSPLPAETALARASFVNGKITDLRWIPCRISGGVCQVKQGVAAQQSLNRIRALSKFSAGASR